MNILQKKELWNNFCRNNNILENSVQLFDNKDMYVSTKTIGNQSQRLILNRSSHMEGLVNTEVNKIVEDFHQNTFLYDGLIYLMFFKNDNEIIPLYIGKAEKYGKQNKNLSYNLNFGKSKNAFARWGDNYAYHIGDLSAVVLPGHNEKYKTIKYSSWADKLFETYPSEQPKLKQEVFFWCKSWGKNDINIWQEYGEVKLTFLEYLLIGVASDVFPNHLLNTEGQNR
jgi:hypothetical protein